MNDFRVIFGTMDGQHQFSQIDRLGGIAGEDGLVFIARRMEVVRTDALDCVYHLCLYLIGGLPGAASSLPDGQEGGR